MKRQIVFHVGQPKTGSSALQAFLSTNVDELKKHGVSYPFPESSDTVSSGYCSGNIIHTMQSQAKSDNRVIHEFPLEAKKLFGEYFEEVVDRGIRSSETPTVVFSAEILMSDVTHYASEVFDRLSIENDVKIVCYLRDIYDYAISAWKQGVKTRRRTEDFESMVRSSIRKRSFGLERMHPYLSTASEVKLINYDVHKGDIFTPFLQSIGVNSELDQFQVPRSNQSNPSLSYSQAVALLKSWDTIKSPIFSALLTRRFRSHRERQKDPYFRQLDEMILTYLREDLQKINDILPDGEKMRTSPRGENTMETNATTSETLQTVLEVANEAIELVANRPPLKAHADLPVDFDPIAYLLLNPDVESVGVDPVSHYLKNGRFEGRNYK